MIGTSQSHQHSRVGVREDYTPQRGATFYSDGSFTTATTSAALADKARSVMPPSKRFNINKEDSKLRFFGGGNEISIEL
jgi:hypothetical protein